MDRVLVDISSLPAVTSPLRIGDAVFGWPFKVVTERGKPRGAGQFRFLGVYEGDGQVCVFGAATLYMCPGFRPKDWGE